MTFIFITSSTIAIVVSFLCSLAESLLLSLNPLTLNRLQVTRPKAAESWRRLKRNIAHPITAILVLNTISHTGGATVAGSAFGEIYGNENIWIFSVLFTAIILFGTEIFPKIIGVTFHKQLAPHAGPILEFVTTIMNPLIILSEFMFKKLTAQNESEQITTADVITLATLARSGKVINQEQENIIVNSVRLSHTQITYAMIPPDKIKFVRNGDTPENILALAKQSGHSRYPVSKSSKVEDIYSFIIIKRVVSGSNEEIINLVKNAKPLHTVNQRDTLLTALHCMLQNREHLLSVVDDKNRCVGIVTLEDIASELLSVDIEQFK